MAKIKGGKALYGAEIGILMLEAKFPRIIGDMGNALTWDFPVIYKVVKGTNPDSVVRKGADGLLPLFISAAKELEKEGVSGISTNCGFLSIFQNEISQACQVPVACSSLMQYQLIRMMLPREKQVGILTISKESITDEHLLSMGIPLNTPIEGVNPSNEFNRVILDNESEMDLELAEQGMIDAAASLLTKNPDIGAVLLECTNMPPYSALIKQTFGIPVFDIYTLVQWFHQSLKPRRFPRK